MMAPLNTAGLAVKQLEWNEYESEGEPDRWDARCCMGSYYEIGINSRGYIVSHDYENLSGAHQSPDEAKAAAQAHYDARILSALESRPVALADANSKDTAKDSELAKARAALALTAGALQAGQRSIAKEVIFTGEWSHLGRRRVSDILDQADTVLSREKEASSNE